MQSNVIDSRRSVADPARSVAFGTRLQGLDGIRGLAVLTVVAFHTMHMNGDLGLFGIAWAEFHGSCWAGVDLFFVLSGFLITGILLDSKSQPGYFRNFYARRMLRIFPLYYAVLAIAILVVPTVVGLRHLPPEYSRLIGKQIWLWTYTQNYLQARSAHTLPGFGHFWTLAVEEQFYVFWPLVVFLLPRRRLLQCCFACCALLPLVRLALVLSGERTWAVRQYTHTRFDSLLYGAIAALAVRQLPLSGRYRVALKTAVSLAIGTLTLIGFRDGFVPFESIESAVFGYSAFGILFAAMIGYVATSRQRFSAIFENRYLRWFGAYSYGIYVFHWPLAQAYQAALQPRVSVINPVWLPAVCGFFLVLTASSITAYLSYVCYEVHFLKLKRFFAYRRPAPAQTIDAANTDLASLADALRQVTPMPQPRSVD